MAFKKGQSGNPRGRRPGVADKRTELRELLKPHANDLVEKAVELAKEGDTTALRLCLDRLIPPIKPRELSVQIEGFTGTLTEQGQGILETMARGELTPTEATSLLQALVAQGKIIETDELVKRVAALEARQ